MRSLLLASLVALAPVAAAQSSLTTTLVGGLVLTATAPFSNTIYADLTVTNPTGLILTQINMRAQDGAAATNAFDVYLTAAGGTHVNNHQTAVPWTLKGTCSGFGTANPTVLTLDRGIYIAPGTYGLALHCKGFRTVYTNGTTQAPPLPLVFSNADMALDCTTSVIQNSTSAAPFSGGQSAVRTPNLQLFYQNTSAVNFTATTRSGNGPLTVNFTEGSVSMDPAGFTVFAWDLDGDGVDDTFGPTASRTYTCGDYSVRLTAYDALGNYPITRTNYVTVDLLGAVFTWSKVSEPALFQFTSTASTSTTSYAWDLDGDTVVDSTVANPTWAYAPGCAPVNVSLTVANSCRTFTRTSQIAPTDSIETTFAANNAGATGYAVNFDANVTALDGIELCGLHLNMNTLTIGTPFTLDVYTRRGTYVGFDTNPAGWTQVSGASATNAIGSQTYVQLNSPIYLPPGITGFTVVATGSALAYTNGTGTNQTFSNADVTLSLGQVRTTLFSTTSTLFTPRVLNVRLNYKDASLGMAGYYTYGAGCVGSLGIPGNVGVARPRVGQNLVVDFTNTPAGVIPFIGFSNTLFQGFPLPIDAGLIGAPGCNIQTSADINGGLAFAVGGVSNWSIGIPLDPAFVGVHLYIQGFSFDVINALGGSFSDAASGLIGN